MGDNTYDGNGWSEYQRLVLHELKTLNQKADKNIEEHSTLREEIASLKVKAGVWGILGGLIPVLIILLLGLLTK